MWGASLADLAKKAKEQADVLATQSPSVGGLFSLDSLQTEADVGDPQIQRKKEGERGAVTENNLTHSERKSATSSSPLTSAPSTDAIAALAALAARANASAGAARDAASSAEKIKALEEENVRSDTSKNSDINSTISNSLDPVINSKIGNLDGEINTEILTDADQDKMLKPFDDISHVAGGDIMKSLSEASTQLQGGPTSQVESSGTVETRSVDKTTISPQDQNTDSPTCLKTVVSDGRDTTIDNSNIRRSNDEVPTRDPNASSDSNSNAVAVSPYPLTNHSMTTMIESTAKLFDKNSSQHWTNDIVSQNNSSLSSTENDGLEEEERKLESLAVQLSMEVHALDEEEEKVKENVVNVDIEVVKKNDEEDENSGWTDVNVESQDATDKDGSDEAAKGDITNNDDDNSPSNSGELVERVCEEAESFNSNDVDDKSLSKVDPVVPNNQTPEQEASTQSAHEQVQKIPQHVIEKFMLQLQRLEENHQEEMQQIQIQHQTELKELQDKCATNDLLLAKLKAAEEKYEDEMLRHNKSLEDHTEYTKDMDKQTFNLKREIEKYQLKSARLDEQLQNNTRLSEQESLDLKNKVEKLQQQIKEKTESYQQLENSLTKSKLDTEAAQEQYDSLKSRVKTVATELKERRADCREFDAKITNLNSQLENMQSEKSKLESELGEMGESLDERNYTIKDLQEQLKKVKAELSGIKTNKQKEGMKGENTLKAYKLKAQNALAAANSRAAAANQAKEEMMIEYQAAKQATIEAEKKARMADAEKRTSDNQAREKIDYMEKKIIVYKEELSDMKKRFEEAEDKAGEMERDIETSMKEQHKIFDEMERMEEEIEKEKEVNADLQTKYVNEKHRAENLMKEVLELRDDQKRFATKAFLAKKKEQEGKEAHDGKDRTKISSTRKSEAENTIALLQDELVGANEAIAALKEALQNALAHKSAIDSTQGFEASNSFDTELRGALANSKSNLPLNDDSNVSFNLTRDSNRKINNNSETPLFFAMEKQAELNIAKEEINRLANMLSDVEASRVEALESKDEMRKRMEEAEARLLRKEKLGKKNISLEGLSVSESLSPSPLSGSNDEENNVNLEYLKNIILQYLNATTVSQRKALIPVIATVLCLTRDELRMAEVALETSSGLQGVGTSLIEGLEMSIFGIGGR